MKRTKSARRSNEARSANLTKSTRDKLVGVRDRQNTAAKENQARKKISETRASVIEDIFCRRSGESERILDSFDEILQSVAPLYGKQKDNLNKLIKDLSHKLTDARSARKSGYMNDAAQRSAYIRYFMWWNLVRFVPLFSNLRFELKNGSLVADVGSGPLTAVCALWIAKPELRGLDLKCYCIDVSYSALQTGEEIFLAIAAHTGGKPWKIVKIKEDGKTPLNRRADLVLCANMLNEIFWNKTSSSAVAQKQFKRLQSYGSEKAEILVVEPGIPPAARFLSQLKQCFIDDGYCALSPCPQNSPCALYTSKSKKWCHFSFSAKNAPRILLERSKAAGLKKDRVSLSYLFLKKNIETKERAAARIISDKILLPRNRVGWYACENGRLVLLTAAPNGKAAAMCASGVLLDIETIAKHKDEPDRSTDDKTGALILPLDQQPYA